MITTPIDILVYSLSWTPLPTTDTLTIGTQVATGGTGILGNGALANVCAVSGPGSTSGPVPTAKVLQGAVVGTTYSETVDVQGGTGPYTFAVTVGSLPTGLSLNSATGVISGTPTTVQTSDFTIQAADANSAVGSTDFEIGVTAPVATGAAAYGWVN